MLRAPIPFYWLGQDGRYYANPVVDETNCVGLKPTMPIRGVACPWYIVFHDNALAEVVVSEHCGSTLNRRKSFAASAIKSIFETSAILMDGAGLQVRLFRVGDMHIVPRYSYGFLFRPDRPIPRPHYCRTSFDETDLVDVLHTAVLVNGPDNVVVHKGYTDAEAAVLNILTEGKSTCSSSLDTASEQARTEPPAS